MTGEPLPGALPAYCSLAVAGRRSSRWRLLLLWAPRLAASSERVSFPVSVVRRLTPPGVDVTQQCPASPRGPRARPRRRCRTVRGPGGSPASFGVLSCRRLRLPGCRGSHVGMIRPPAGALVPDRLLPIECLCKNNVGERMVKL